MSSWSRNSANFIASRICLFLGSISSARPRLGSASFRIVLTEGRNQQIRRMCKALSLGEVKRLHRVSVAGINLDGLEGPGEWAALDEREQALIEAQLDDVEDGVEIE